LPNRAPRLGNAHQERTDEALRMMAPGQTQSSVGGAVRAAPRAQGN
jgi:hypothetical protein